MIATWMFSALLFTACLTLAAVAADTIARATGRPTRWIWCAALAAGALWPIALPLATRALPRLRLAAARLPALTVIPDSPTLLGSRGTAVWRVAETLLLIFWALASVLLVVRLARAAAALRRVRARAEQRTLDGVPVLLTDRLGPATIGLRRTTVIVPRTLLELDEGLRALVLRHETEHGAARDPWLLLAASVGVAMLPWNAPLWFIARRLRLALEIDCDARVLASGAEPTRYGQLLLWIAQHHGTIPLAAMLAAGPSHLERRIAAMHPRLSRHRALQLFTACGVLTLAVFAACSEGSPNGPLAGGAPAQSKSAAAPTKVNGPYLEFQVEGQAQQIPGSGNLTYPASMRMANREGEVLAQFVVNEQGVVETTSFKVLKSSDPAFTAAVRNALPGMRFRPAVVGGRAVKQLVQQPFTFGLQRN
jgi:TonB family protein